MSERRKNSPDRTDINERDIERRLVMAVRAAGGICPKLVSPGTNGMPRGPMMGLTYEESAQF